MVMDRTTRLENLCAFLNCRLQGARCDKALQPWPEIIQLVCYHPVLGNCSLLVSVAARHSFIACSAHPFPGKGPPLPLPAFVMALRKYLGGARLAGATLDRDNNVLVLGFSHRARPEVMRLELGADWLRLWPGDDQGAIVFPVGCEVSPAAAAQQEYGSPDAPELEELEQWWRKDFTALFARDRQRVVRELERKCKRKQRALDNVLRDRERFADWEAVQQQGELVKSQLHKLKRGMEQVELDDYFAAQTGARRVVRLDPKHTPQENMERIFRTAAKYRRGLDAVAEREQVLRRELASLEQDLERVRNMEPDNPWALLSRVGQAGGSQVRKRSHSGGGTSRQEPPYRLIECPDYRLYVGKNAAGNDWVSFRMAAGNDLWFHCHNYPGAHVVLKPRRRGYIPQQADLRAAALVALYYSSAREKQCEDVIYTEAKNLKRMKGRKQGQVQLAGGKVLRVTLQEKELRRILDGQSPRT